MVMATTGEELCWNEFDGERIDAVAGVFGSHLFAGKYMAEMSVALGAEDFSAETVFV